MGDVRYRAASADMLRIVPVDALTLIFDRRSGVTHVVAAPVPEIIEALGDAEFDTGALMARLSSRYDLGGDVAALAARLEELVASGLVERA